MAQIDNSGRREWREWTWSGLDFCDVLNEVKGGNESAKTKLAWLKLSGVGGAAFDESGAVELLEERVKRKDGDAMWMLGVCCEYGRGTEQDIQHAEELYKQSRDDGNEIGKVFAEHGTTNRGSGEMHINCVKSENMDHLMKMSLITPWTALDLSGLIFHGVRIGFNSEGAKQISELLMINTTLTKLCLTENTIGDEGAKMISESLMINTVLTELDLSGNSIKDEGGERVGQSLMINTSLTKLDLSWNYIRNSGAKMISESLMKNSSLTELDLGHNNIEGEGIKKISESLNVNNTLTILNLSGNSSGNEAVKKLCESLKVNTSLIKLDIERSSIGFEGAVEIGELLTINSSMTKLNLRNNFFGSKGEVIIGIIAKSLMANSTLTELELNV